MDLTVAGGSSYFGYIIHMVRGPNMYIYCNAFISILITRTRDSRVYRTYYRLFIGSRLNVS